MMHVQLVALSLTLIFALLARRFLAPLVVGIICAGLACVGAFIAVMTWLDLDKFALLGPLFGIAVVWGVPYAMRERLFSYLPLSAALQSTRSASLVAQLRAPALALIGLLVCLTVVVALG